MLCRSFCAYAICTTYQSRSLIACARDGSQAHTFRTAHTAKHTTQTRMHGRPHALRWSCREHVLLCVLYALGCRILNKRQQQQLNTLRMSSRPTSGYSLCALYYRICCYELCTLNAVRIGTVVREQLEHCMHWTTGTYGTICTHTNIKTTQVEELACMQHTHTHTHPYIFQQKGHQTYY